MCKTVTTDVSTRQCVLDSTIIQPDYFGSRRSVVPCHILCSCTSKNDSGKLVDEDIVEVLPFEQYLSYICFLILFTRWDGKVKMLS